MTILIITDLVDPTADLVIDELARRGIPTFRCNPGDFPQRLALSARLGPHGLTGTLKRWDSRPEGWQALDLEDVGCAYYRRPTAFRIPDHVPERWQAWAAREARQGFGGVISALPRWLNHPADIARAEYKPVQLRRAAQCGLPVPRTIVTNDPDEARRFGEDVGDVVHKRLSATPGPGDPFTHLVDPAEIEVADTAHLLQERIDKAFDVRVTVVDATSFGVRIEAGRLDWRADYPGHVYQIVYVPAKVRRAVRQLMAGLNLRFAALDFGVTAAGEWVFFDLNPNGQWAWIQERTGLQIAYAVANALTRASTSLIQGPLAAL